MISAKIIVLIYLSDIHGDQLLLNEVHYVTCHWYNYSLCERSMMYWGMHAPLEDNDGQITPSRVAQKHVCAPTDGKYTVMKALELFFSASSLGFRKLMTLCQAQRERLADSVRHLILSSHQTHVRLHSFVSD